MAVSTACQMVHFCVFFAIQSRSKNLPRGNASVWPIVAPTHTTATPSQIPNTSPAPSERMAPGMNRTVQTA
eukprot:scaffold242924_cov45-Prasinocladus_malaysianus.AAC.1